MNLTDIQPENQEIRKKRLVLVVSKGTIDMIYPALVLATTAPAMGMTVDMYFTFWGLKALTKNGVNSVKIAPVGNPGMPMPKDGYIKPSDAPGFGMEISEEWIIPWDHTNT
mgnify:CR=1 FL=1